MNNLVKLILFEKLKGWRTFLFNSLIMIAAALTLFMQETWVIADPKLTLICVMIMSSANIILRLITNTPIGIK